MKNSSTHKELSDFLAMKARANVMSEQDLDREKVRFICGVIRYLSFETNQSVEDIYQQLKTTETINYMKDNWRVLHSFDIRRAIDYIKEFHTKQGGII